MIYCCWTAAPTLSVQVSVCECSFFCFFWRTGRRFKPTQFLPFCFGHNTFGDFSLVSGSVQAGAPSSLQPFWLSAADIPQFCSDFMFGDKCCWCCDDVSSINLSFLLWWPALRAHTFTLFLSLTAPKCCLLHSFTHSLSFPSLSFLRCH